MICNWIHYDAKHEGILVIPVVCLVKNEVKTQKLKEKFFVASVYDNSVTIVIAYIKVSLKIEEMNYDNI